MSNKNRLINIFVENWTSVFHTILGREAKISIESVEKKKPGQLGKVISKFQTFISLSYGDDKSQHILIALKNMLISIISNLMIGLDTFNDEISADEKDAFEDVIKQMFSACQLPIKEELDLDMKFRDIIFVIIGICTILVFIIIRNSIIISVTNKRICKCMINFLKIR